MLWLVVSSLINRYKASLQTVVCPHLPTAFICTLKWLPSLTQVSLWHTCSYWSYLSRSCTSQRQPTFYEPHLKSSCNPLHSGESASSAALHTTKRFLLFNLKHIKVSWPNTITYIQLSQKSGSWCSGSWSAHTVDWALQYSLSATGVTRANASLAVLTGSYLALHHYGNWMQHVYYNGGTTLQHFGLGGRNYSSRADEI